MVRVVNFVQHMIARFPVGTFERIAEVLQRGEDRTAFVRAAVEREIKRRERMRKGADAGPGARAKGEPQ